MPEHVCNILEFWKGPKIDILFCSKLFFLTSTLEAEKKQCKTMLNWEGISLLTKITEYWNTKFLSGSDMLVTVKSETEKCILRFNAVLCIFSHLCTSPTLGINIFKNYLLILLKIITWEFTFWNITQLVQPFYPLKPKGVFLILTKRFKHL